MLSQGKVGQVSRRRAIRSGGMAMAMGCMAWVGGTARGQVVLNMDPATLAWGAGVDLVVKVSLANQGGRIDIVAGTLYADVVGAKAPVIQDIKVAGAPGTPQYVAGTFLTGGTTAAQYWTQQPLQTSDPSDPANTVGGLQATAVGVAYFTPSIYSGPVFEQEIPGHASAPFAEITLRRGAGVVGSWTLNLYWSDPLRLSFMDLSGGPYDPADLGKVFMNEATATVTAVPEPGGWALAWGVAMGALACVRGIRARGVARGTRGDGGCA